MRHLKQLLCVIIPVIIVSAAVSGDDQNATKDGPETDSRGNYYIADGRRIGLTVLRNRIGIALHDAVEIQAAREVIDDVEWELEAKARGGIVEVRTGHPREIHELEAFIRRVNERNAKLKSKRPMISAGLLVLSHGSTTPMLLTEEFVVQFREEVKAEDIAKLNTRYNVEVVRQSRFEKNRFLLRSTAASDLSYLEAPIRYHESGLVELAHPNFIRRKNPRQTIPNDPLFPAEWHHENTGQNGGTPDADIDTPLAWDITRGSADRVIAVIDFGFNAKHPDLIDNLWTNPQEIPDNGIDDDGNGYIDDVNGWNFEIDGHDLSGGSHGTNAAGCAGARGNNGIGVSGTCPRCSLMLIVLGLSDYDDADAFEYARHMGAEVVNCSWGYTDPSPIVVRAINRAARQGRKGRGCVIFFAMPDDNSDACGCPTDISSLDSVIAVSGCSNTDRFDNLGFGDCMDVLAPTRNTQESTGTLGITTTDSPNGYTDSFGDTSAAAPIAAGIAALVLEVAPSLTRLQIQRLMQDTCDKIEDSSGNYNIVTGFSAPEIGSPTHGYGRVNAFEAVRVVAATALGGRGGVDVLLRDNRLDWGNTEQPSSTYFESPRSFIPYWESPDIVVDAPPFQPAPTSSRQFDLFTDEQPLPNTTNRVYVRIRNRGPHPADSVTVKLHWALAGPTAPALPADFWTSFPADSADTSQWHPLEVREITHLHYCGTSISGGGRPDVAQIAAFNFTTPAEDPTQPSSGQYSLLCVADSSQDAVSKESLNSFSPDWIVPRDNNIALRNVITQPSAGVALLRIHFTVRNPVHQPLATMLAVKGPVGWTTTFLESEVADAFMMKPSEQRIVALHITAPKSHFGGEIRVEQLDCRNDPHRVIGGLTIRVRPAPRTARRDSAE